MTARDAVLGIDLGTSVVKAGIYTLDGVERATGSSPIPLRQSEGGRVEQDLDEFYQAAAQATRQAVAGFDAERIAAIAIAGQMAGVGIVDADHRPLAPYDSWLDTRCGGVVAEMSAGLDERIIASAGCAPTISIGPKMLWWQRYEPEVCAQAAAFVTAAGYVAGRAAGLSGSEAFIDPSHLHFTSVADVGTATWDDELVEALGLAPELLPTIVESTSVVGRLTQEAAADFGLPAGIPIAAGCGDTAAGAMGAGVTEPGQAFDVAGTAAVFGACTTTFAPDVAGATLMTMRSALQGRWYSLAYVGGAGQVIEWACREVLGRAVVDDDAYAELADAAVGVPPGSEGVMLLPHFNGRIAPVAPDTRGAVIGLTGTRTRAHLARATLESIAYEYRGYADAVHRLVPDLDLVSVTGVGGGSRSAVWNQIKADVLGVRYTPVRGVEAGTRGAALVAIEALGHGEPRLEPTAFGPASVPDPSTTDAYRGGYEQYRWWTDHLVEAYRERGEHPRRQHGESI